MRIVPFVFVLFVVLCLAGAGCSPGTPPAVTALQVQQEKTLVAYVKAETEVKVRLLEELEQAVQAQVEIILDYEIELAEGDSIKKEALKVLLGQYRQKRAEVAERIRAIKAELAISEVTAEQLIRITSKIGQYLAAQKDELEELRRILDELKGVTND